MQARSLRNHWWSWFELIIKINRISATEELILLFCNSEPNWSAWGWSLKCSEAQTTWNGGTTRGLEIFLGPTSTKELGSPGQVTCPGGEKVFASSIGLCFKYYCLAWGIQNLMFPWLVIFMKENSKLGTYNKFDDFILSSEGTYIY